jgi:hypothetical protein
MRQRNLASIELVWDSIGRISHSITDGHGDDQIDCLAILAPSLPMLVSHQLGTMKPSQGLGLCSAFLDFFIDDRHILLPINSALKGAKIQYIEVNNQNITLTFHPKHSFIHNSDSLEEGVRQFLNNYALYVTNKLPLETYTIVKGMVGSSIDIYTDFLSDELKTGRVASNRDRWHIGFANEMHQGVPVIASMYGPKFESGTNLEEIINDQNNQFVDLRKKLRNVMKNFGLIGPDVKKTHKDDNI